MTPAIDLRTVRIDRGIGLEEAAEEMGVHRSILARAESGENKPHPKNAFKIASFYGYKVTEVWPVPEAEVIPLRRPEPTGPKEAA